MRSPHSRRLHPRRHSRSRCLGAGKPASKAFPWTTLRYQGVMHRKVGQGITQEMRDREAELIGNGLQRLVVTSCGIINATCERSNASKKHLRWARYTSPELMQGRRISCRMRTRWVCRQLDVLRRCDDVRSVKSTLLSSPRIVLCSIPRTKFTQIQALLNVYSTLLRQFLLPNLAIVTNIQR